MSGELTLPLHCGHVAPVEWTTDGSLWLIQPKRRLGGSVVGAMDAIKRQRIKCARCKRSRKRPAQRTQRCENQPAA